MTCWESVDAKSRKSNRITASIFITTHLQSVCVCVNVVSQKCLFNRTSVCLFVCLFVSSVKHKSLEMKKWKSKSMQRRTITPNILTCVKDLLSQSVSTVLQYIQHCSIYSTTIFTVLQYIQHCSIYSATIFTVLQYIQYCSIYSTTVYSVNLQSTLCSL